FSFHLTPSFDRRNVTRIPISSRLKRNLRMLWNWFTPVSRRLSQPRRASLRLSLEPLETRETPTVNLLSQFDGTNNTGCYPPDTNAAVGPNYVVETVNESLAIYNKSTGSLVSSQTLKSFFGANFDSNGGSGMFDPSVMYDEQSGRFIIEVAVNDSAAHKSY